MSNNKKYDFKKIEEKWRDYWENKPEIYSAKFQTDPAVAGSSTIDKEHKDDKKYVLVEFPYPSGSGLHIGHAFTFTGGDVYARFKRMQGYNVLFPMGWDAFGLPTENYAIKVKRKPQDITRENTDMFRKQMKELAYSFDWEKEVNTTNPDYYKWTQWIFIKLFEKGLAYKQEMPINWCPSCKIGLANEEVVDGKCERCGDANVTRRNISQWIVKITDYADKLIEGLKGTDFVEKVKMAQINWIGKSEGAHVKFSIDNFQFSKVKELEVFTTRPDTLYGATFMVVAPEHDLVSEILNSKPETVNKSKISNDQIIKIRDYVKKARTKSDMERAELTKDKTGVFSGKYAINPVNGKKIPVWISDFVLANYGTGAIMAVPAHDERDFAFAKKFGLPIIKVIDFDGQLHIVAEEDDVDSDFKNKLSSIGVYVTKFEHGPIGVVVTDKNKFKQVIDVVKDSLKRDKFAWVDGFYKGKISKNGIEKVDNFGEDYMFCYTNVNEGKMINSSKWNGLKPTEAIKVAIDFLKKEGIGKKTSNYHLRDWIFSRQHYWGEPIPMVKCDKCGWVPVPVEQLPIELPEVNAYEPTDTGESPLAKMTDWVKTTCPVCGEPARRETDTMPNWAGSDWYYLGYLLKDTQINSKSEILNSKQIQNQNAQNSKQFNDVFSKYKDVLEKWMPVDVYIGGDEHNTLHLLYSRFIYQFLHDLGVLPENRPEPYYKRISHGVILGPDGTRMSKTRGNVIIPDDVTSKYGVDVLRSYLMFMGPFDNTMPWNEKTLMGVKRFLDKFYDFVVNQIQNSQSSDKSDSSKEVKVIANKLIDGLSSDLENFKYNTAIAKMMEALNNLRKSNFQFSIEDVKILIKLLAPFAPYMTEELYAMVKDKNEVSVHVSSWPIADKKYLVEDKMSIPVAINGKKRGEIEVDSGDVENKEKVLEIAKSSESVARWFEGKEIKKEIYVPGRMVNLVI